jgi:hypothetical protein
MWSSRSTCRSDHKLAEETGMRWDRRECLHDHGTYHDQDHAGRLLGLLLRHTWVGELAGQDVILGMDFMIPAGIRLDLADGTMCLPVEVRIQLAGRRLLYGRSSHDVTLEEIVEIEAGEPMDVPIRRPRALEREKLWVARGQRWVPTVTTGLGRTQYMTITNISDEKLALPRLTRLGLWLAKDLVPRLPGLISVGSRRYAEWQNLARIRRTTGGPTTV